MKTRIHVQYAKKYMRSFVSWKQVLVLCWINEIKRGSVSKDFLLKCFYLVVDKLTLPYPISQSILDVHVLFLIVLIVHLGYVSLPQMQTKMCISLKCSMSHPWFYLSQKPMQMWHFLNFYISVLDWKNEQFSTEHLQRKFKMLCKCYTL